MDLRGKTVIASFIALMGLLAATAFATLPKAEANTGLTSAIFGH